jgi:uncharacterized protein
MRWLIILLSYSFVILQSAWGEELTLTLGNQRIRAVVANTPESREQGLMHQTKLCQNCGMIFIFSKADRYSFWMKNTPLPLSIAFIEEGGRILNITEMQAHSTRSHVAQGAALYALEMNKGWFTKNGISSREQVHGLAEAPQGK